VLLSEAGYFDGSAVTKPLLHLWSLGIEEQFYIVWPVLLYVGHRARRIGWVLLDDRHHLSRYGATLVARALEPLVR